MAHIVLNQSIVTDTANTVHYTVNVDLIPVERRSETVYGLIAQGVKIIAQRAAAGKDEKTRAKETRRIIKEIQDGIYEFGGGGGGPRLTDEDEALRQWLDAQAAEAWEGKKSDRKPVNNKEFPEALETAIRQYLISVMTATGKTEKEIKETLTAKMDANRDKVKERFLARPDVQTLLASVRTTRNGAEKVVVLAADADGLDL